MSEYQRWKSYYESWSTGDLVEEREQVLQWIAELDSVPMRGREDGYGSNFNTPNDKLDAINDILEAR